MRWAEVMTNKLYQGSPESPPQHYEAPALTQYEAIYRTPT